MQLKKRSIVTAVHLGVNQPAHGIPQKEQALDAAAACLAGGHRVHLRVFAVVEMFIHLGKTEILHLRVSRERFQGLVLQPGDGRKQGDSGVDILDGPGKLLRQIRAGDRDAGHVARAAVHAVVHVRRQSAQHHPGLIDKVLVDRQTALCTPHLYPVRLRRCPPLTLLEDYDVRRHVRPGICPERIVGQPYGPQQLTPLGDIPAHSAVLLVQRVVAGDKGNYPARAHLVDGLGEEIIVDREFEFIILGICHVVLAEGDVAHGNVKKVIRPVGVLKPLYLDTGFGVEHFSDAPGDGIQLGAVEPGTRHCLGQQAEKVAHAQAGLQQIARPEAHAFNRLVDGLDYNWASVVRVEDRFHSGLVFLGGQQGLELFILLFPGPLPAVKGLLDTAPADIAVQDLLLLRGGMFSALRLNMLQGFNGGDIRGELGLGPALAQVIVRNAEVPGRGLHARFHGQLPGHGARDILQGVLLFLPVGTHD